MLTLVQFIEEKSTILSTGPNPIDLAEANGLLTIELLVGISFVVLAGAICTLCFFSPLPLALIITFQALAGIAIFLGLIAIFESLGYLFHHVFILNNYGQDETILEKVWEKIGLKDWRFP
ncbi:MAG: hypothetical protein WDZ28_01610 [Simkaniaceae bacterium]